MKKIISALLAGTLAVAVLAGCGKSSGGATMTEGKLIAGTNAAFPPFEYIGDDGQPDGFDIALIKEIGKRLGYEVEIQDMEFGSLVAAIGSKIDVAIAGMTITDERKQSVDFAEPYYDATQYVIINAGADIKNAEDLKGKAIGCQLGTTGETVAQDAEGASVNPYDKAVDAVNDLVNGRVDCVIIDKNPAEVFKNNFGDKIEIIDGAQFDFEIEQYGIAAPKGSQLVADINKTLEEMKADGTFAELEKKYILGE
ncbi:MAG: basic amino acid ABC transporter substrate-binding protein [Lachnospiraceae bacterium]|nr:basic amino acid ABC transporter substrate-binding protein [Lachnospiraceae bacterium]